MTSRASSTTPLAEPSWDHMEAKLDGYMKLELVNSDEAQLLMTDFGFIASHAKK